MGNNRYKTSSMLQIKSDAASLTSDDSGIYSAEFVLERNGSRFVAKKDFQVEVESPPVRENIKFETFPPGIGNGKETKRYLETFISGYFLPVSHPCVPLLGEITRGSPVKVSCIYRTTQTHLVQFSFQLNFLSSSMPNSRQLIELEKSPSLKYLIRIRTGRA